MTPYLRRLPSKAGRLTNHKIRSSVNQHPRSGHTGSAVKDQFFMKIQIDGTNTQNKGAELMLLSVLEQIEARHPEATVVFNSTLGNAKSVQTNLSFTQPLRVRYGRYIRAVLHRLGLPHFSVFSEYHPLKNIDLVLDASGFRLGDQWDHPPVYFDGLENYYKKLKQHGSKIILLPQAFGPFHTETGKRSVRILNRYADLIVARETVSRNYLLEAGGQPEKIIEYPDFTITVKGIFPDQYREMKGRVCIIPNKKMITHTSLDAEEYSSNLISIIAEIRKAGEKVFLLNHEGEGDLESCLRITKHFNRELPVVSGLNAREIKGMIGASRMVISSRYHGVASSLHQGVPCLATSWSHKYEMLFHDYDLTGQIIDLNDHTGQTRNKIQRLLDGTENSKMRRHLNKKKDEISRNISTMWNIIWEKMNDN